MATHGHPCHGGTEPLWRSVSESWRNRQMLAKSGQKTALAGDWPKAIASQSWLNEGRRRGDIASASPAPMTDIANILRRNGQFSSGTSFHSVKQAPACWGLRPQSPKREASADKATAAPHVAAALCQAQGWLPRISPILNVPSPADWRNLDATAVLIARPSPKLPRGPETLLWRVGPRSLLGQGSIAASFTGIFEHLGRPWSSCRRPSFRPEVVLAEPLVPAGKHVPDHCS